MRMFQAGTEPVAVVAIGVKATGVVAIGPFANGVLAIGQLSVGVITVGQISLGLFAIGQMALSPIWAFGQLVIAPLSGGAMLALAPLGRVPVASIVKRRPRYIGGNRSKLRIALSIVLACTFAVAWWYAGAAPLLDAVTKVGGIFRSGPRVLK